MKNVEHFNQIGLGRFPEHIGMVVQSATTTEVHAEMPVTQQLMAPNGFLHAGALVSLADTCAGYGCILNLPDGASGFTTVELKSNHLGTTREGTLSCVAKPVHVGKTTQVWDATVTHKESGKTLALFRCTQLVLRARA
jgi:1,4-dihydroxy-2-naphthoyl-CoA hydrolase